MKTEYDKFADDSFKLWGFANPVYPINREICKKFLQEAIKDFAYEQLSEILKTSYPIETGFAKFLHPQVVDCVFEFTDSEEWDFLDIQITQNGLTAELVKQHLVRLDNGSFEYQTKNSKDVTAEVKASLQQVGELLEQLVYIYLGYRGVRG